MSEPLSSELVLWWWRSMVPLAIQALVLVPLVALIDRLLPRRTWPQLRAAMWLLVMARLVLPPAWLAPLSLTRWSPWGGSAEPLTAAVLAAERSQVLGWVSVAFGLWAFGGIALGAVGILGLRRAKARWQRGSHDRLPPGFDEIFREQARRLSLSRMPRIRFGATIPSPFVAGLLRPTIYLPEELLEPEQKPHLEHVLLHELAHVRRGDLVAAGVCKAITLLYWFHPGVWWADRRLAALREQCCDQTVARALQGEVAAYRRTLLFFASKSLPEVGRGLAFLRPESVLILRLRLLERPLERPLVSTPGHHRPARRPPPRRPAGGARRGRDRDRGARVDRAPAGLPPAALHDFASPGARSRRGGASLNPTPRRPLDDR